LRQARYPPSTIAKARAQVKRSAWHRDEEALKENVEDDRGVKKLVPMVEEIFSGFSPEEEATGRNRGRQAGQDDTASIHAHPDGKTAR
jgi:hypothetical protein